MAYLEQYEDFVRRVDALGFMALSKNKVGLPYLGEETRAEQWHTGDAQSDPWQWKDRAAAEKTFAYGCILGGQKGFVSARLYPAFVAACRPAQTMPERWEAGEITQTVWRLWQLFEERPLLNTAEVRGLMGVSKSSGAGRIDAGIQQLEAEYAITTAGVRRKVAQNGQPYGWPATVYDRVERWAPPGWLREAARITPRQARLEILDAAADMERQVNPDGLAKLLWGAASGGF